MLFLTRASPTTLPEPVIKFKTPAGRLLSCSMISASRITVSGVSDGGLIIMVFPHTREFPNFLAANANGKFQATIPTVTP